MIPCHTELDEVTRKIMQLEIEEAALQRKKMIQAKSGLKLLEEELANLKEKGDAMKAKWQEEKEKIQCIQEKREQFEKLRQRTGKGRR